MNILFIHPNMFHPHRGGIERVSDLLCREFIKRGHYVLCLYNIRDESRMDYAYPTLFYFFPCSANEINTNGPFYRNFLQEHHIDIVINQEPLIYHGLCSFSKDLKDVHTISVIHYNPLGKYDHLYLFAMWAKEKKTIKKNIRRIASIIRTPIIKYKYMRMLKSNYKDIFAYTDLVCLLSVKFIPDLKLIYSKNIDRVIAIPNPNTYLSQEKTNCLKKKQLLYVGRIEWRQKRIERLIDIWMYLYKDFPDWELVIVGDGTIRQQLEESAAKMERVVFTGWKDPEPFYRDASILCLTSDFEGWGMVITEAMTFGTIPVAFNSYAAVTDIIEDGKSGILVPPFSCEQFAQELGTLMNNEALRIQMSEECMRSVKQFDIEHVVDKWEEVFDRLKIINH